VRAFWPIPLLLVLTSRTNEYAWTNQHVCRCRYSSSAKDHDSRWDERRDGALMLTRTPPVCFSLQLSTNPCAIIRHAILAMDAIDYWRAGGLVG